MENTKREQRISNTTRLSIIAMLSAVCVLLTYFEIPFLADFLKLEVSDVIVILATILLGFKSGLMLVFIKGVLHALLKPGNPVGEIVFNFGSILLVVVI
ncbi:MAG: ECF transporter S component, partial [Bacilli bacterium]